MFLFTVLCLISFTTASFASPDNLYSLSDYQIPLSGKEQEALKLATDWAENPSKPLHLGNGKVVYMLGATMPTVIVEPMTIADIELQAGETIIDVLIGDSQRWLVEMGTSGSNQGTINHVFVKPIDSGLKTSLIVTTSRRVYHIKLVSNKVGATPYVGFIYPEQSMALHQQTQRQQAWQTTEVENQNFDMSKLNFKYKVSGNASWKPIQVFDTGSKMYFKLPETATLSDIPILMVMNGSQETLVNYRYRNHTYEIDGVFDKVVLITGIGSSQVKVTITGEK